jgi:hypothetical protein
MKPFLKWSRRCLLALLLLPSIAWVTAKGAQWVLRYQGVRLLADVHALEINRSTEADVQALMGRWRRWSFTQTGCGDDKCNSRILITHVMPSIFREDSYEGNRNFLARVLDNLGLRSEAVLASMTTIHGVVTTKGFAEDVGLPMRDWFLRGGAYVPDLDIWSGESSEFNSREQLYSLPIHPFRVAHFSKGPYGLTITFTPQESAEEQSALMDFQLNCLTRFIPCRSEGEVLPEGWRLMREQESTHGK